MAVYQNRARDIVKRLILLRDYLHTNASPTHAVKAKDMLDFLESKGIKINIKTLYSDITMLETYFKDVKLGYDGSQKGYVLYTPPLSSYDLRLIVNSIQAAQFITQEEANRLTNKMIGLADEYTSKLLDRRRLAVNRVRTMNDRMMKDLDIIYEAIAQDSKIRYKYFKYALIDRKKEYQKVNNSKIITASPYRVIWEDKKFWIDVVIKLPKDVWNDKYFGCDDTDEIDDEDFECEDMDDTKEYVYDFDHLDVGQMEDIAVFPERREGENTFLRYSGISSKNSTVPFTKTRLKVSNMYISDIIDKFGSEVSISPAGHTFFIAAINEEPTPEMYIWTREFSPPIEIVFPENAEAELREYFSSLSKGDNPDVQLMKEVFQNREDFLSLM